MENGIIAFSGKSVPRANDMYIITYTELAVVLNRLLVILLDVVGEVVHRDVVVLDVLHNALLEATELTGGKRVGLADDRDDINAGGKAAHKLDVHLPQRVAGGRDEVQERVHPVVAETRVTLDTGLLGENIVVLALEVTNDLLEAGAEGANEARNAKEGRRLNIRELVVDVVTKARGINNGQGDADTVLLELWGGNEGGAYEVEATDTHRR